MMTRHVLAVLALMVTSAATADGGRVKVDACGDPMDLPRPAKTTLADPAASARGPWSFLGPYGGDVACVAASPIDSQIVLAGVAPRAGGGALYRSTDGGESWMLLEALAGLNVNDIEFASDGTAYAGTIDGVYKSVDGGAMWMLLPLGIGGPVQIFEIAADPADSAVVWVGIDDAYGAQPVNVMKSTDAGGGWINVTPPHLPLSCKGIAFDPTDSQHVCACFAGDYAGGGQIWITHDAGATWTDRSAGLPDSPLLDVIHDGGRILVGGGSTYGTVQSVGLYYSTNDGQSWSPLFDESWPQPRLVNDIELDPNDPDVILLASGNDGVYRSTDAGVSWDFGIGSTAAAVVKSVRFAPGNSSVIFAGARTFGVARSDDGGASFQHRSRGIMAFNVLSVEVNPLNCDEMAAALSGILDGAVLTSQDGGQNWWHEAVPTTRWNVVRFAPDGRLYALSEGPTTIADEGVYRRSPEGVWTCLGPDQGPVFETELHTIAFSDVYPGMIFAGGSDFGVAGSEATIWRTLNDGVYWEKLYEGFQSLDHVRDIEFIPDSGDLELLAAYTDDGWPPQEGGVLRSSDGGGFWTSSMVGLPATAQPNDLCRKHGSADVYFLASRVVDPEAGGVFRSDDAGQAWTSTGFVDTAIGQIVGDPTDAQVLYATRVRGNDTVLKSLDEGATFEPFGQGLPAGITVGDLRYLAGDPPRLLLATSCGVWLRDLDGVCPGDVNGDGTVNVLDLLAVIAAWGNPTGPEDINGDGIVDVLDLLMVIAAWGPC